MGERRRVLIAAPKGPSTPARFSTNDSVRRKYRDYTVGDAKRRSPNRNQRKRR